MARRYNPTLAFLGFLVMMAGAVTVVTVYALYQGDPGSTEYVALGVIMTLVGWLVQRIFSHRGEHRR